MADDEQFSLCWNNFNTNLSAGFHESLIRGDLVDVTLAAEGQLVKAHRLILSVCSPYFRKMFTQMPANQHAFIFLKDVSHSALKDLIQFMYCGEVNVKQDALPAFISTAEALQIKGLTETGESAPAQQSPAKDSTSHHHLPSSGAATSTASSPRIKPIQRTRIQSYKLDSDDGGSSDHEKVVQIQAGPSPATLVTAGSSSGATTTLVAHTVSAAPQQVQIMTTVPTVSQATKRTVTQRASITPQTTQVMKRAKMSDPLEASEPAQIQTVQIVKQITQTSAQSTATAAATTSSEPEYVEMPIETINPKAEPEYADDPSEVEAIDAEHDQEQALTEQEQHEHDQEADDSANYVEDETYGDMSKYDESYFTEGDDAKAGASGFGSESYTEGGAADQAAQATNSSAMMEPTIKIEEDSVVFDEYAFYSSHNMVKPDEEAINDDDDNEDGENSAALVTEAEAPTRRSSSKRSTVVASPKLQITDLFQISNVCSSQSRNLMKQPFPIQTVNELNELDTLLLGNPAFMEKCAQMLHNAVRNETLENVTGHMRLLLEFAVDYSVLLKYSWFGFLPRSPIARGMGEQQPFRNLIGVIHLLHRARRLRYGKCSLEEIHEGIEKFLKRKLRCHALFVKKQNYVIQSPG